MALTFGFFNASSGDRVYDAVQMSKMFDGVIEDGVFASIGDAFLVTEHTGMQVRIGTGRAWFNGTWTLNDSLYTVSIDAAHATLSRIDVVYLEINESTGVRANSFGVKKGTAAGVPSVPSLTNTSTVHQYALAHILIGPAVTTLPQSVITNKVGLTATPFVQGPLGGVSVNSLLMQWEAQWTAWFEAIQDQLTTEAETNLQAQIWAIVGDTNPPLLDLLDLKTHHHGLGFGNPIVSGGIADGAVIPSKIPDRTRSLFIPWKEMHTIGTSIPLALGGAYAFPFSKSDDNDALWGFFQVPRDYSSTPANNLIFKLIWTKAATGTAAVRLRLEYAPFSDTGVVSSLANNAIVTDTHPSASAFVIRATNFTNLNDIAAGNRIMFKLGRDVGHASDTWANPIYILGVEVTYTAEY